MANERFESAKIEYENIGVDVEAAINRLMNVPVSMHCWQGDDGKGIADVKKAMEPMYTTRPDLDRSGMGFAFMEAFMDQVEVKSEVGVGTIVRMKKTIGQTQQPFA